MSSSRRRTAVRTGCVLSAFAALMISPRANAQDTPAAPPAAPPASPAPPVVTAPTTPSTTAPPATSPVPPDTAPAVTGAPTTAEPKWHDTLNVGAFIDTYYSMNWGMPKPQAGTNRFRPYDANNGFSLSWVGLDLAFNPGPVGAVANLRFGPSTPNLALGDFALPGGVGNLAQAYVSWKPDEKVTLILGKFDTIYGAEVSASQLNINYTRGALYNLAQPFFHTGFRADVQLTDLFGFKLMAVNGWNNTIDNNKGKSFGGQVTLTPSETLSFALGYLGGPEQADRAVVTCAAGESFDASTSACIADPTGTGGDNAVSVKDASSRLRHIIDVVADIKPTKELRFLLNGDYVTETIVDGVTGADKSVAWYGVSAMARYQFSSVFAGALRGEYIGDKNNQIALLGAGEFADPTVEKVDIMTGTLTLEAAPSKYLLIRLDNRIDAASEKAFLKGLDETSKTQFTTTLGVVAKTN